MILFKIIFFFTVEFLDAYIIIFIESAQKRSPQASKHVMAAVIPNYKFVFADPNESVANKVRTPLTTKLDKEVQTNPLGTNTHELI